MGVWDGPNNECGSGHELALGIAFFFLPPPPFLFFSLRSRDTCRYIVHFNIPGKSPNRPAENCVRSVGGSYALGKVRLGIECR